MPDWIVRLDPRRSTSAAFRAAAAAVFAVGAAASVWAWATASETIAEAVPMSRVQAQEFQLERLGGKFAVEAAHFQDWFASFWQGRALAPTLAVVTVAATLLCLWIAHLASFGPDGTGED